MALHRRTAASAFADKNKLIITMFSCFAYILLWEQTTTDAYSILPPKTRGAQRTIQRGNQRELLVRHRHKQTARLSLPLPLDTSLRASPNFDYLQNSTAASTFEPPESRPLEEEENIRLISFMEEALLELRSFQKLSNTYPNVIDVIHDVNDDDDDDDDLYYAFSSGNKDTNKNDEVSLLFPNTVARAGTDIDIIFNDSSAAIRLPMENNVKSDLNVKDDAVDEEAIWRARWLLIGAAALYGTNFSVVKLLGDEMPVGISTSLRFGLAALATLPWLVDGFLPNMNLKTNDSAPSQAQLDRRIMAIMCGLEIGLWNSIGYVAQAVGLETTLASESAFLCSMAVVVVPLLDWAAGKKLLPRQCVGALMALVGVAFLELGDMDALLSSTSSGGSGFAISTGDALSMVQPFMFGLGFWRMEQAMNKYPEEARRMTAAQLMAIFISSAGYGLWTLGVFEPFFNGSDIGPALAGFESSVASISTSFPWKEWFTDPSILFSLFWTGCITTAMTIYMETLALESLSAAETTLIFSTEPLWGTAFAVAVMGEQMGMNAAVGAAMILTACLYSNLGVQGLQEMWTSTTNSISGFANQNTDMHKNKDDVTKASSSLLHSLQDHWPWLPAGLVGSFAAWNVASDAGPKTQELHDIVEGLIENLVDKQ
jgi:drug/metabolite transporter (DMT)-like permease